LIGLAEIHLAQWTFKESVIQKNQRIQGDTPGIGSDMTVSSKMLKEPDDIIRLSFTPGVSIHENE
jgi:hypothetical protein